VESRSPAVLLVDDRADQRLSLGAVLGDLGVEVVEAASGREALRWLLRRSFAVILLDVNMPDMDGFETAALVRQRPSSEHTPIIFVTAYGDDAHAARGYSLGAVDYILAPVDPNVLRTKVNVFLELFRKTDQIARQAESLRHHAGQLRRLADAAVAIHAARGLEDLVKLVADTAASIVGASQVALGVETHGIRELGLAVPPRDTRHAVCRPEHSALDRLGRVALAHAMPRPLRMTADELDAHPSWGAIARAGDPPLRGWLATPLSSREGRVLGWLQLSERHAGDFTAEDETVLVQLAQMAAIAAENTIFDEAHEASRLKDRFLATLSHELRTPLQSILSWSHMLRQPDVDRATAQRGLEVIERNARAQTRLIEDLLDVSRIISGKLVLERRLVRLADVVAAALEDALPAAQAKEVALAHEQAASPAVVGDPHRLRQVVDNLLSNAVKFTPRGGSILVRLEADRGEAVLSVEDTGPGIDPSFAPHLFEPFRQADSSTTRAHKGLGIGLAIVRQLVEVHGGTVHAESRGGGQGARFRVRLPIAAAPATQEPAVAGAASQWARLDGLRVLLVEDEADTRESLVRALQQYGADVTAVDSSASALEALDVEPFDVLLSDLGMPGEDGFALIRRVRARPPARGGRVPAVALSAYARSEERARAVLAGFDAHVAKPIEPAALSAAVLQAASRADG